MFKTHKIHGTEMPVFSRRIKMGTKGMVMKKFLMLIQMELIFQRKLIAILHVYKTRKIFHT